MSQTLFDVVFTGTLADGAELERVKANLSGLFKVEGAAVERLFSGKPVILKRGADRETALKYQQAMRKAGALCQLREARGVGPAPANGPVAPTGRAPAAPGAPPLAGATLAPPGVTLVEVRPVAPRVFDLSAFSLAAPGSDVLAGAIPVSPPTPPSTGALSLDPPGVTLIERPPQTAVPLPDVAGLTIAEAGVELGVPKAAPAAPLPDISGITLAPPGSDLGTDRRPPASDSPGLKPRRS